MEIDDNIRTYLEFIQGVISRMNGCSSQIKGWATAILAAAIALFNSVLFSYIFLIGIVVVELMLCLLDMYYLWQEHQYRDLYDLVRKRNKVELFDMNAKKI